jgi:alkanesulfonate monooxygenase SsuD/methylene tetrahydromethanopterin reductase-like flavin-dependent oxidoreductase (luciferase family)
MQIGIDSFAGAISDLATGLMLSPVERMHHLLEEMEFVDRVGLDVFGIGEHHRAEFLDSAPVVVLSAAAARTESIRLTSAVTVLSGSEPVRIFQEFATLDLISRGRAEIVAGRGSFVAHMGRCRRHPQIFRSSRNARTSSHGCHHRR